MIIIYPLVLYLYYSVSYIIMGADFILQNVPKPRSHPGPSLQSHPLQYLAFFFK